MEKLNEFPQTRVGRTAQYDFDTLFNGSVWKLSRGDDFPRTTAAEAARTYLSTTARRRGLQYRTSVPDKNTVVIQITGKR